ncbi:hypothetical protein K440DRAFT_637377 [Wilcoxina mikolae CBS 423.85]|nr:hypothetical protein K440DRAFT_637377 [Wilcoxina mikolae CBS 423.85]
MDFNSLQTPKNVTYILGVTKWFWMPRPDGSIVRAVAVTSSQGTIWVAAYALLLILIFVAIAQILKDVIISLFPLRGNGNRYAMLVGYYNANDPISIMMIAVSYCWKCIVHIKGDGLWDIDWGTFWLGISLVAFSIALLLANAVGGLLVPGNLRLGHIARVSPDSIFYPDASTNTPHEIWQRFKGPACARAAADLVQARIALKDKYYFSSPVFTDGEKPTFSFNYSYMISGYEFGFQRAPGLHYTVNGSCETEYNWISNSTRFYDIYDVWNSSISVPVVEEYAALPYAEFVSPAYSETESNQHIRKYAIIPHTVGRRSPSPNTQDPWYITEPEVNIPDMHHVKAGRPALSCQQGDTWEFRGQKVMSVSDLQDLSRTAGLKLASFYSEKLLIWELAAPAPLGVGQSLGYSALASALQLVVSSSTINLTTTSIQDDIERIILTTLIYTRGLIQSTALAAEESRRGLSNALEKDGKVPDEYADFVLSSPDIATMSVKVLLITPAVCTLLWVFIAVRGQFMFADTGGQIKNDSYRARYIQRTIAFSCVQLYRFLDEELSGERRWAGRLSFTPYVRDVSAKYNRRYSDFEVVPASARISSHSFPSPSLSPSPRLSRTTVGEGYTTIPSHPDLHNPDVNTGETTKPLVTPFARPALVPLHQRSSSSPASYDMRKSVTTVTTTPSVSFSANIRRPTSDYIQCEDRFELAMTRHWRPSLKASDDVRWSQVQRE